MADRNPRAANLRGGNKPLLLRTASAAALAALIGALPTPAEAQLAARRGAILTAPTIAPSAVPGQIRSAAQQGALDRQVQVQSRAQQIRTYATQARAAVTRTTPNGLNGLQGLVVATGVNAQSLASGALQAARDSTGRMTWQGASLPVESTSASGTLVQINQTDSRAILSWNRFDVGDSTTLQFNQKVNGVAQKDWVAVNRVVDPAAAPSQIMGQIKADGIVVVVNHNGVIFGQGSQVSASSLLASSLDIGNAFKAGSRQVGGVLENGFVGTTLQDRNIAFLQNGLLQGTQSLQGVDLAGQLTSSEVNGFYVTSAPSLATAFTDTTHGDVLVERGASLTAGTGGFVILTGPRVSSDGSLSAAEGQVSLQAGHAIAVTPSTGASSSADPNIRGLILRTPFGSGTATNTGLIETRRGYASLGAGLTGSVTNGGLIAATTSVSRNGTIALIAGTVNLAGATDAAQASGLVITPDDNGETIPQGSGDSFKTSQIMIGAAYIDALAGRTNPLGDFGPGAISIGTNALVYAPNANVQIGGKAGDLFTAGRYIGTNVLGGDVAVRASKVDIADGALIDVSGVKDLQLDASRNSLKISPLKRNELRDTPNYRESTTDGSFTLNGTTVYVDPRLSGVRSDGVAWIGSPLIEAGSAASQIAVTAAELMTAGGAVSLNVGAVDVATSLDLTPKITIARSAAIDFSGGWVSYKAGTVRSSRLLTADGRVINIGNADPNDIFVAVGDGFTEVQSAFGISRTYASSILQGAHYETAYDEGRDAGSLIISASAATLDGTLYGNAFAGTRQLAGAVIGSVASKVPGDTRLLQGATTQLPAGGYLRIGAFATSEFLPQIGDIMIGAAADSAPVGAIRLDAAALGTAGIAALSLNTTGGVTLAAGRDLTLASGGSLTIVAGRSVNLAGDVTIAGGSIAVTTFDFGRDRFGASLGSSGSPFRSDDDLFGRYAADPGLRPFDITVGGKLSTAGLWTNDFIDPSRFLGSAWKDGGSISLTVAPNVFVGVGTSRAADLSGSIRIASGALLDVSAGGHVSRTGALDLTGQGGDVALINATRYASVKRTDINEDRAAFALGGNNQTVQFTSYNIDTTQVVPGLVPDSPQSDVSFETASIRGFGFAGGGTFRLIAPDIAMGGAAADGGKGPRIGLDFLQKTGFGTLDLTASKSRLVSSLFNNGLTGYSAFVDTERFVIGAGETLDLTQTVLPSVLSGEQIAALSGLGTGADIYSVLTPIIPEQQWDRLAANLTLGGVTELDVESGGQIIGSAQAAITLPRLYNAGTIRIAGGSITQRDTLETLFTQKRTMGVRDVALGGGGLSDVLGGGVAGQTSGFDETALTKADVFKDSARTQRLTNGELFSLVESGGARNLDVNLVFTGKVALNEGIHLATGSVTDLSGTALYNPRAALLPTRSIRDAAGNPIAALDEAGQPRSTVSQLVGTVIGGGSITTARLGAAQIADGYSSPIDASGKLVADAGATLDISGASGLFDERISSAGLTRTTQWSDAGRLTLGNGAVLAGADIRARGGDDGDADALHTRATGGILDWQAPIISQTYDNADRSGSWLAADQIMNAGFATLIARDGLTTSGAVNLNLDKSLIVTTTTPEGVRTTGGLMLTAQAGSVARIKAGYVGLVSSSKTIANIDRSVGAGSLTLAGNAIDVVGAVAFNVADRTLAGSGGFAALESTGDIRMIGTAGIADTETGQFLPGLSGQLVSNGNLLLTAGQVYATTGTGDLQALLEARRAGTAYTPNPFIIASANVDGLVQINGTGTVPDVPYSAGSYLAVRGAHIEQNGVLRTPLGLLDIGSNSSTPLAGAASAPSTKTVVFGANSITSVSARTSATGTDALTIPYGTTTDLIEYFFTPGTSGVLTTMPVGELRVGGADIEIMSSSASAVRVDGRGGGDVFAFEFISGTGGSRDVLDRLNPDIFSGNNGFQYADGRQVYAILPKQAATAAMFDPIYSADYAGGGGIDLYGLNAGMTVKLEAAPGIAAGEYVLLPAHYALLPGALRLVENVGQDAPFAGGLTLLDGSVMVGGTYATAGTNLAQSQRRSFTVSSKAVFGKYSNIQTTSATTTVTATAQHDSKLRPQLAKDAARVVLDPLTSLKVAGAFATDAATGGTGAQFDIGGTKIRIAAPGAAVDAATADYVLLTTDTMANFNANSLSIGALRTDNENGTTTLNVTANQLLVDYNVSFSAPELILAVGGQNSALTIADAPRGSVGAQLVATGTLDNLRTGDYVITASALPGDGGATDETGAGALLRLANGPLRQVSRQGTYAVKNSTLPARLEIGARSVLSGAAITLDSSRGFAIDRTATIGSATAGGAFDLAVSGDNLRIGSGSFAAAIEAQFGKARNLYYRTPTLLTFVAGGYTYNNLTIDAQGIQLSQPLPVTAVSADVSITAAHLTLKNSASEIVACSDLGARLCSGTGGVLTLDAADITFGDGTIRTYGFDTVNLQASQGMYVSGKGAFSTANFDETNEVGLNLTTPFIVDRTAQSVLSAAYVRPDYTFSSIGPITVSGTGTAVPVPAGNQAPGARIAFQAGSAFNAIPGDVTIDNALVRATAGAIEVTTPGSIHVTGTATLDAGGYTRTFDDGIEKISVSAGGGIIKLTSTGPGTIIDAASTASLIVDNGIGNAGTLALIASQSDIDLQAMLNPGVAATARRSASFLLDTGFSAFDLPTFVATHGLHFQGDIAIRSGAGDLTLDAGQVLSADSVSLTADGGLLSIAGMIDTSGDDVHLLSPTDAAYKAARVDGGAISLFGRNGVTVTRTAALVARTSGYAASDTRQGKGGDVTIGIGIPDDPLTSAALTIAAGATIDVSAVNVGTKLIAAKVTDATTLLETTVYRLGASDLGGTLTLRAPVRPGNRVAVLNSGTVSGARELTLEGYKRFDLDAIAAEGTFAGVTEVQAFPANVISLDAAATEAGKANFLSDIAAGTLPDFVRNFSVVDSAGNAFAGYRVRPGIELVSANAVRLDSNWNLGAGQVDVAAALAAGLMIESPLGAYTTGPLAGQPRYEVVAGKEGQLFENYVDMVYRVGGSVRGEAPVLAVRAAGDLTIRNSISDGFFAFRSLTDADYINYQLGGGHRTYHPALRISCGAADASSCGDSINYADAPTGIVAGPPATRITINIGTALQGSETTPGFVSAPYNPLANAVAARGSGDPLGEGELFPLFADGSAARSTSLKLVAGAAAGSANPLQTDVTLTGTVRVNGEKSYSLTATRGTAALNGSLELVNGTGADSELLGLQALLERIDSGESSEYSADYYTVLNWGQEQGGAAGAARNAALNYAAFQTGGTFLGGVNNRTGVSARLRDIIAFMIESGFADQYAQGVTAGLPGYRVPASLLTPIVRLATDTAYVGTVVRTGDGNIDIAAATDIDLRRSAGTTVRREPTGAGGNQTAQLGSSAVYTAGVRVSSADLMGGQIPAFGDFSANFVPGPTSGLAQNPVFSKDGGSITLTAGRDVLGRRDVWGELYGLSGTLILGADNSAILQARRYAVSTSNALSALKPFGLLTSTSQLWRVGSTSLTNTVAAVSYNQFSSGVGALAGGDVTITAGRDLSDLTIALDNSLVTGTNAGAPMLVSLGAGDLTLSVGRNLLGGQFDVAMGKATAQVGGDVAEAGLTAEGGAFRLDNRNLLRVRVADATFDLTARGKITVGGVGALGLGSSGEDGIEQAGFFSPIAGFAATASGDITIIGNRPEQFLRDGNKSLRAFALPPSLELAALNGNIGFSTVLDLARPKVMASSEFGQLSLLAGGSIANFALAMSDAAPINMFGMLDELTGLYPTVTSTTSDADLRRLHNRNITHLNDALPVRIVAGGDINDVVLSVPKQARVHADGNIIDLFFQGQNLTARDITRITAGGDITGTTAVDRATGLSAVRGNSITVGGPGALYVEAGRDLGPFITSAEGSARTEAGGIRTVGDELNPWLGSQGANIYALFGVAKGVNYTALQSVYLDPANLAQLDGDLFVQTTDTLGNAQPDRTKYTYAPILATWLRDNAPEQFAAVFGAAPPTGDALTAAAYTRYADIYAGFTQLDALTRTRFLIDKLYFGELAAPSDPNGPSYNQFVRGYRAVQTLFPASAGYTDNLATYTTDPATVNADHPLGVPVRTLVNGQPVVATRVNTGNVDLRLSTIETARNGNITILGPGGNFIAGSLVRTSAQIKRRFTAFNVATDSNPLFDLEAGIYRAAIGESGRIRSIPAGFEGVLTLRGGNINGFTDGSFVLNQSRLFTQAGGDITLWSSNGDLNAGQGPKSASNFPPIVVRFDPSGFSEVNSAGSVAGAGIGAFKSTPTDPDAAIRLIAPVGTVDAGDAGVRASGSVFVAAARVANADSFSAGGSISGVPALAATAPPPVPAGAAAAIAANAFNAAEQVGNGAQRLSRIFVDVLGYFGGSNCPDGQSEDADGKCVAN